MYTAQTRRDNTQNNPHPPHLNRGVGQRRFLSKTDLPVTDPMLKAPCYANRSPSQTHPYPQRSAQSPPSPSNQSDDAHIVRC